MIKSNTTILTNFYPIYFELVDNKFKVIQIPNKDGLLKELREDYNHTHSFFKHGDFVYASNMLDINHPDLGGKEVEFDLFEDKEIAASLIKHIFFRVFREKYGLIPYSFYPFRIESQRDTDDLIGKVVPATLKDKIAYKKQIEVSLRMIYIKDKPVWGFVINIDWRWIFNINCFQLNRDKFDIIGRDVSHSVILPGLDKILAPDSSLVGSVKSINGDKALVETNEGDVEYLLEELYLKKSKRNISDYLTFKTSQHTCNNVFEAIDTQKAKIYNAKSEFIEVDKMAKSIAKDLSDKGQIMVYKNKNGFIFRVKESSKIHHTQFDIEEKQEFIFNPSGTQTCVGYPDKGLTDYSPYDNIYFTPKAIKVLTISLKSNRGFFSTFIDDMIEGIPSSRYFKKGLRDKYNLHRIDLIQREVDALTFEEYDKVISQLDEQPDIALIEIDSKFRQLPTTSNPYYLLKARLLTKEIPVQFITSWKVKKCTEFIHNALCLQIYAKLGGVPWVLPANKSVDREIIVGISHSKIRSNSYQGSDEERVVGIATFFSSDGQYLSGNKTKDVTYENYFGELLKNLRGEFEQRAKEDGWKKGDIVRLIFHIFKPIKNEEFRVVSELVKSFSDYTIQFAFVRIKKTHPFKLYDTSKVFYKGRETSKGEYIPKRGTNLVLSPSSCLIQLLGRHEVKTPKHGVSNPMLIEIDLPKGDFDVSELEPLLFTDLHYIVQQIYSFTHLSWRTFLAENEPVTMQYSYLISKMLGNLRLIAGWKPDSVNLSLKHKKWFL